MKSNRIYFASAIFFAMASFSRAGVLGSWEGSPGVLFFDSCLSGSVPVAILCWLIASVLEMLFCRFAASWVARSTPDFGVALGWAFVVTGFRQLLIWNYLQSAGRGALTGLIVWLVAAGLVYGWVFARGPKLSLGWWRGLIVIIISTTLSLAIMGWVTVGVDNFYWLSTHGYSDGILQLYILAAAILVLLLMLVVFLYRRCPKCGGAIVLPPTQRAPLLWRCGKCDCRVDWSNRMVRQIGDWYSYY